MVPEELQRAIESLIESSDFKSLKNARAMLSEEYRKGAASSFNNPTHLLSYLITRLPATFGACSAVFQEIRRRFPDFSPQSMLDLGAGPGTATWAALDTFGPMQPHLIERERAAIDIGKKLGGAHWNWQQASLEQPFDIPSVDLAVFSYVFAEVQPYSLIDCLWEKQIPVIAIIEPGTPKGFERIRAIRLYAIQKGAHLIAPCPHAHACPMPLNDWCHFSARIPRTRLHRLLKEGTLGHEDEKYSYVVFSRHIPKCIQGRVIRSPQKNSGFVKLPLCASDGQLKQITVTRSDKNSYRAARDAEWGSAWPM